MSGAVEDALVVAWSGAASIALSRSVSPASFGEAGSVVTLICDGGGRCLDTCFDERWLDQHGDDIAPYYGTLEEAFGSGRWP